MVKSAHVDRQARGKGSGCVSLCVCCVWVCESVSVGVCGVCISGRLWVCVLVEAMVVMGVR